MSKQVKRRRGTAVEHEAFTGAVGEITVDTTEDNLRIHDGVKVGGHSISLMSIARSLNVPNSAVIYSTDTVTVLDDVSYIYNAVEQVTYSVPTLNGTGETIVSVTGNQLITTGGTYTLAHVNTDSIPDLSQTYTFKTVADMQASDISFALGKSIACTEFHTGIQLPTPNNYIVTNDVVDGKFTLLLSNGLTATLQHDKQLFIERIGAKPDLFEPVESGTINTSKTDNLTFFVAAKAKGLSIVAFGAYYLSAKLDLGDAQTQKRANIRGLNNRNFDGWQSVLGFDGVGDGVEFFAGAEMHDMLIYKIADARTGTGVICENMHAGKISNVTTRGWARGIDSFSWINDISLCIAYLCTHGIRLKTDSTSTTLTACYVRSCDDTGFDIDNAGYCTLISCGVDNTPKPYIFNTANSVAMINCGTEFNDGNAYSGFIWLRGTGYVNLTVVGGKWLIAGGSSAAHFIYSTFQGTELAEISVSGLGSKANLNLTGALVNAKANVLLSDDCHLGSTTTFSASGGGMFTYKGKSFGSRRPVKQPKVSNVGGTGDIIDNGYCRQQRVVDLASLGGNVLYVEIPAQQATSISRGTIKITPLGSGEANGSATTTFGTTGSFNAHFYNDVGAGIISKRNNTLGNNNQSLVVDVSKWANRVVVDVIMEGKSDSDDPMFSIVVGPQQWS